MSDLHGFETKQSKMAGLITGLVAVLSIAAFFIIGFTYGIWQYAWIIFLTIPLAGIIAEIALKGKYADKAGILVGLVAILSAILYFCLGYFMNYWYNGWIVFFLIPLTALFTELLVKKSHRLDTLIGIVAMTCLVFYLLMGFVYSLWHVAWIIFLLIPITAVVVEIIKTARGKDMEKSGRSLGDEIREEVERELKKEFHKEYNKEYQKCKKDQSFYEEENGSGSSEK
jgi:signal transduction histidine kinase